VHTTFWAFEESGVAASEREAAPTDVSVLIRDNELLTILFYFILLFNKRKKVLGT
jgi:hypothetical protein